jgi:PAS domain S-box-containing protein
MAASGGGGLVLDPAALAFMFPCYFSVDAGLRIVSASDGLLQRLPGAGEGALASVFQIEGDPRARTLDDLRALQGRALILHARADARVRLRGVVSVQGDGGAAFLVGPAACERETAAGLEPDPRGLSPFDGAPDLFAALKAQAAQAREAQALAERLVRTRDEAVTRQEFFDAVVQMLPTILMVKDARSGRYVLVNRAAEEILGVSAKNVIGRSVFELFPPDEALAFSEEDQEVIASGEMKVVDHEVITTANQGRRSFTTKKVATYGEDGPRYIVTVGEDITERHETALALQAALAAAEEAALSKSVFLANMSHEIRTPLNGIVAIADILTRNDLEPKARDMVEIIRSSGETLERLLSDILDQARIESGQITLEAAPFHLGDMVRATAALADLKAQEKGVAVRIDLSPEVDATVLGDMVRVRQILTNLLSNAVKFTDQGAVTVTGFRDAEGLLRLEVEDTGPGFDEDTKSRIFGRFQQADNTITRRFGGTGLGLAISRELAGLMGGCLDCEGRPGRGATFWFEIPLPCAEALPGLPFVASAPSDTLQQLRVLVADDHPTNRKVIQLMLEGAAEVTCAENGQEALDILAEASFDLVLMDMQMPVMDGLTAIRHIRAGEAVGTRTPIIMLTANALPEHVAASLQAGADRHLDKPITAASLFAAVAEVFARQDSARAA